MVVSVYSPEYTAGDLESENITRIYQQEVLHFSRKNFQIFFEMQNGVQDHYCQHSYVGTLTIISKRGTGPLMQPHFTCIKNQIFQNRATFNDIIILQLYYFVIFSSENVEEKTYADVVKGKFSN